MRILTDHRRAISSVAFSPCGSHLAEAAHGGETRVWDLMAGEVRQNFTVDGMFPNQTTLAYSREGDKLAAASGNLLIQNVNSGIVELRQDFPGVAYMVCQFSPDSRHLLLAGDGSCSRWEIAARRFVAKLPFPASPGVGMITFPTAAYARQSAQLAVSRKRWMRPKNVVEILVFDETGNYCSHRFQWSGHEARTLTFHPDGALLAAACGPVLRVWSLKTNALEAEIKVGKLHFMSAAFSPCGRYLGTVCKDRTARLWRVNEWNSVTVFDWNIGKLLDIAFAPDGLTAAVASDTGKILLFDVD